MSTAGLCLLRAKGWNKREGEAPAEPKVVRKTRLGRSLALPAQGLSTLRQVGEIDRIAIWSAERWPVASDR